MYPDGLACFNAVTMADCATQPTVVGGRKPRDLPEFQWINTVLRNLKTSLSGTYHAFAFSKYADRCLAALAYRFNRRFDLATLPQRLLVAVVQCRRHPERELRVPEHSCQSASQHRPDPGQAFAEKRCSEPGPWSLWIALFANDGFLGVRTVCFSRGTLATCRITPSRTLSTICGSWTTRARAQS